MKSHVLLALLSASSNAININQSFINTPQLANMGVPENLKLHPVTEAAPKAAPSLEQLKASALKQII